jgi:hypothetical protein
VGGVSHVVSCVTSRPCADGGVGWALAPAAELWSCSCCHTAALGLWCACTCLAAVHHVCLLLTPAPGGHPCCCHRAAGWSSLSPDDAEVVTNMQAYLRSLLQEPPAAAHGQHTASTSPSPGVLPDSRGWSPTQCMLVSGGVGDVPTPTRSSCARVGDSCVC